MCSDQLEHQAATETNYRKRGDNSCETPVAQNTGVGSLPTLIPAEFRGWLFILLTGWINVIFKVEGEIRLLLCRLHQ